MIIVRQTFWFTILLIIIAIVSGFIFYRYTKPLYESSSVVQIKSENRTRQLFGLSSSLIDQELAPAIELIRSNEFLKTCIEELPLEVSYFNLGTFLSSELYGNSPFEIKYRITNDAILDEKVFINFSDVLNAEINYQLGSREYYYKIETNQWHSLSGFDIYVDVNASENNNRETLSNEMYFVINNPRTILQEISSNLSIQTLSESAGTILISYSSHNAKKAADITNTIAQNFIKFDENRKRESANNVLKYIDQQMDIVLNQLNESERILHAFRQDYNIVPTDNFLIQNRASYINSRTLELESNIFMLEMEISTLKEISSLLEHKDEKPSIYELLALLSGQQSERFLSSMLSRIISLQDQREILLFDVTPSNYRVRRIDAQIESQRNLVIDFIAFTIERLQNQQNSIIQKIEEFTEKLKTDSSYDEVEYATLLRIHAIHEDFYSQLIKTKAETMISHAGFVSDNLILEKASVATNPYYPNLSKSIVSSIGIALLISFLILFLKYLFYNRINTVRDISEFSDIPIIGGIPQAKVNMNVSKILLFDRPKSMMAEAFRNIRTNLEFYKTKTKAKVVTVSSTISEEGKTFVALNIASIFSMANKKVIVLDLDMRKPRIHKSFNVDNDTGVSSILIGKKTYEECINHIDEDNLHYITSGPIPPNPAELMLQDSFKQLIQDLSTIYDIIIIDTPPIGIVTDALASYKLSDIQLYVMRTGISPKSFIQNVKSFKDSNNLNNLGIILNGIERSNVRFGYGYKTGYGYQYGYSGYGYGYGYLTRIHNSYYGEEVDEKTSIIDRILNLFRSKKVKKHFKYLEEN